MMTIMTAQHFNELAERIDLPTRVEPLAPMRSEIYELLKAIIDRIDAIEIKVEARTR